MGFRETLRSLDAYPKLAKDMRVKTISGAAISVAALAVIALLATLELADWQTIRTQDHLVVDMGSPVDKMKVLFNVTFPRIPCSLLSIDVMDVSGEQQLDLSHHISKTPLNQAGEPIGAAMKQLMGTAMKPSDVTTNESALAEAKAKDPTQDPNYCGTCYGAEEHPGACCNTCEEVRRVYRAKGWALGDLKQIEQCLRVGETNEAFQAELDRKDGCNVQGYVEVQKVSGNFHFAPGKSFQHAHVHVHDLAAFTAGTFNISHQIHNLQFGTSYPGAKQPLDNSSQTVTDGGGMFMYYAKVVPTSYVYLSGDELATNQFSVTRHLRKQKDEHQHGGANSHLGLPGVFFFFELSPIKVFVRESRQPLTHLLARLCAIVGGVFTVTAMLDRFVYHGLRTVEKKMQLNKLS